MKGANTEHSRGKICIVPNSKGGPRRTWLNDVKEWTGFGNYGMMIRMAEDRFRWRQIATANL